MAKVVNEVFSKVKGDNKITDIITGKGVFSKQNFKDEVNALANDTTYKIKTYDKDGKVSGEVCVAELIRNDVKKSVDNAKYPQKSEAAVFDTSDICTSGLAEAIPYIIMEHLKTGKKFDLPAQPTVAGSIYLKDVPGGTSVAKIRDITTKQELGTVTTKTKDSVKIAAKSPIPSSCIIEKIRKDVNGKIVNA